MEEEEKEEEEGEEREGRRRTRGGRGRRRRKGRKRKWNRVTREELAVTAPVYLFDFANVKFQQIKPLDHQDMPPCLLHYSTVPYPLHTSLTLSTDYQKYQSQKYHHLSQAYDHYFLQQGPVILQYCHHYLLQQKSEHVLLLLHFHSLGLHLF